MIRSFYAAASGMYAQQTQMDLVANNLANVSTTAYKQVRAEFQDLLYAQMLRPGDYGSQTGTQVGHGARLAATQRIFTTGALVPTENDLDLAIEGPGFFRVQRPDGSLAYTRDGAFRLDGQRRIVTQAGDLLLGEDGPITVPAGADRIDISADGTLSYTDPATQSPAPLGRLTIVNFTNPGGLLTMGQNLLAPTVASGEAVAGVPGADGYGRLVQGFLEGSNVEVVNEMVNLLTAQRVYEMNAKALQASDEMAGLVNNLRRG